jgi:hypothetical protein
VVLVAIVFDLGCKVERQTARDQMPEKKKKRKKEKIEEEKH